MVDIEAHQEFRADANLGAFVGIHDRFIMGGGDNPRFQKTEIFA